MALSCRWRAVLTSKLRRSRRRRRYRGFRLVLVSAFGFFFSRLLLSFPRPFAISSSILHRHGGAVASLSASFVLVSPPEPDRLRLQSSCRSCKALLLAGTTPTVDGDPRTSEPPCRERLIEIDGFVGHVRAPHKRAGFRLEGPRVEGSEGKRVSGLGRSIPCNIAKRLLADYTS